MPERNVEKLKRMKKELAAVMEKNTAANVEIVRQKGLVREAREGAREIGMTCDALLVAAVLSCGAQVGAAAWELRLPQVDVLAMLREYRLTLEPDGARKRLRVTKRGADGAGGV